MAILSPVSPWNVLYQLQDVGRSLLWRRLFNIQLILPNVWRFKSVIVERVDNMILKNVFQNACVCQFRLRSWRPADESPSVLLLATAQDNHHKWSAPSLSGLKIFFEVYFAGFKGLLIVCSDDGTFSQSWIVGDAIQDGSSLRVKTFQQKDKLCVMQRRNARMIFAGLDIRDPRAQEGRPRDR